MALPAPAPDPARDACASGTAGASCAACIRLLVVGRQVAVVERHAQQRRHDAEDQRQGRHRVHRRRQRRQEHLAGRVVHRGSARRRHRRLLRLRRQALRGARAQRPGRAQVRRRRPGAQPRGRPQVAGDVPARDASRHGRQRRPSRRAPTGQGRPVAGARRDRQDPRAGLPRASTCASSTSRASSIRPCSRAACSRRPARSTRTSSSDRR